MNSKHVWCAKNGGKSNATDLLVEVFVHITQIPQIIEQYIFLNSEEWQTLQALKIANKKYKLPHYA